MMLNEITEAAGARKRRKRVGRGESSGLGKTCGRGNKGCQSRAGGGVRPLTEGGQMPIFRRLPKRGFSNFHFARVFEVVNLADLQRCFGDGDKVDPAALADRRLIRAAQADVKVLGSGTLSCKLTVSAHAFSKQARELIEKAGGTVQELPVRDRAALARGKRNSKNPKRKAGLRPAAHAAAPAPPAKEQSAE